MFLLAGSMVICMASTQYPAPCACFCVFASIFISSSFKLTGSIAVGDRRHVVVHGYWLVGWAEWIPPYVIGST